MNDPAAANVAPAAAPDLTPVLETIDRWRNQLLDFSGRNRSLFYRATQSTLTLTMGERAVWDALREPGSSIDLVDEVLLPAVLPAASTVNPSPRAKAIDDARKRLRSLQTQARTFLDEQGVHVLHVPVGWLTWPDDTRPPGPRDEAVELSSGKKARLVRSPLLFLPVALEQTSRSWRLSVPTDGHIEANLTLLGYLESVFHINVAFDEEEELDPAACLTQFQAAIGTREHWRIELDASNARLDTFSFKKVALLRELDRSHDLIAKQTLLRALCGDAAPLEQATNLHEYTHIDAEVQPGDVALAVAADSSQLKAILAVLEGNSMVIQGPPGTGKSQTITNLISSATARGKRVLFVAEKRAARDVVVSNLDKAHLSDLVLHITEEALVGSNATAKKDIAEQLRAILEQGPGRYALDEKVPENFRLTRDQLNAYVSALHTPLGALPQSTPFLLLQAWATCRQELLPSTPVPVPPVRSVDQSWLDRLIEAAKNLDDLGGTAMRAAQGPWLNMLEAGLSDRIDAIDASLQVLIAYPDEMAQRATTAGFKSNGPLTHAQTDELKVTSQSMAKFQSLQNNLLRFFMPGFWKTKSQVQAYTKSGGSIVPNARQFLAEIDASGQAWDKAQQHLASVYPVERGEPADVAAVARQLRDARGSFEAAQRLVGVVQAGNLDDAARATLLGTVNALTDPAATVTQTLDVVLFHAWAVEAVNGAAEFALTSQARARLRDRFNETDVALLDYSYAQALNAFAPNRPGMDTIAPAGTELGILRSQIAAKRRKPLRWLFSNAPGAILRLKPCIVASPLAVAQFLSHRAYEFDLVIFDEASQIPTADAVVAMSRGRQVIVVGDSQQMPPTSFFDRALSAENDNEDEFEFESILQQCEALLPSRRLLWHYRSRDERLIAFSNRMFYDGSLQTFPAAWAEPPDSGVKFEFVENAEYGRGGTASNPHEADRAIEVLVRETQADPRAVVAITAMSTVQQTEIQNRLEAAAATMPAVQAWLDAAHRVKNLETVQGDECDVMILSFGYGKDSEGNMRMNFGPLSRDDGYRRLNVAATRARRKTILVASIRASDIPTASVGSGGRVVRQYIDYAERGQAALEESAVAPAAAKRDGGFEAEVAKQLRARGWTVDTQVGVGKYRIDIGVRDPNNPGRYLAGIECDGSTYRDAESARDRDLGRRQVVDRLGWRVFRVWSPDWFRARDALLDELEAFLRANVQPTITVASPAPPPPPAPTPPPAPEPPEPAFVPAPDLPAGVVEYEPHDVKRVQGSLPEHVKRVVLKEGPLHEDELFAAMRDDLGVARMGSAIRQELQQAIDSVIRERDIEKRGEWYWPATVDESNVPVRVTREERRKFDYYTDEEINRAIELTCGMTGRLLPDQLVEATARFLGFSLTAPVRLRLTECVGAMAADRLQMNADGTVEGKA